MGILDGACNVITETEVERQTAGCPKVILHKQSERFHAEFAPGISKKETPPADVAVKEIIQIMEIDASPPVPSAIVVNATIAELSAKTERMLPHSIGNGVGVVLSVARRSCEGPTRIPAQIIEVGGAWVDARK